jgi:hypothetical protein
MELVEPITSRPAEQHATYIAAVDMSSGLSADSAACAVSHYDPVRNQTLLDGDIEVPPPFNAANAIEQIAKFLMPYQTRTVYGDRIGLYYITPAILARRVSSIPPEIPSGPSRARRTIILRCCR